MKYEKVIILNRTKSGLCLVSSLRSVLPTTICLHSYLLIRNKLVPIHPTLPATLSNRRNRRTQANCLQPNKNRRHNANSITRPQFVMKEPLSNYRFAPPLREESAQTNHCHDTSCHCLCYRAASVFATLPLSMVRADWQFGSNCGLRKIKIAYWTEALLFFSDLILFLL